MIRKNKELSTLLLLMAATLTGVGLSTTAIYISDPVLCGFGMFIAGSYGQAIKSIVKKRNRLKSLEK